MKDSISKKLPLPKDFFIKNPIFLKNSEKKRLLASSFIGSRKDIHPIYSITQSFHLIQRPPPVDSSIDLRLIPHLTPQNYDYIETGTQNFFSKQFMPPPTSPKPEFPRIKRKIYTRMCKGSESEVQMVPYNRRIKTVTDLSTLKTLIDSNKELKRKITKINRNLNKSTTNPPVLYEKIEEKIAKKANATVLNYTRSEKSIPVKDSNWQRIIRRTADGFSRTRSEIQLQAKVKEGIVDVSYPYCKCCKREWLNSIEFKD